MGLIAELLPFLLAAFLLDCVVRVRRHQALFSATTGRSFRLEGPGWRGAGLLPTSESYLVASLGLRATESGVLLPPEHGGAERLVPYDQMERVTVEGDQVRLRAGVTLQAPHPSLARSSPPSSSRSPSTASSSCHCGAWLGSRSAGMPRA